MLDLTIEELDQLIDGLSAEERSQVGAPSFIMQMLPTEVQENEEFKNAKARHEEIIRARMEATTLLKAKLIGQKTVLQARALTQ